jgi:hypothetical protein
MPLDAATVRRGCRGTEITTARRICRDELHRFRAAAGEDGALILGCTQETPLFSEIAEIPATPISDTSIFGEFIARHHVEQSFHKRKREHADPEAVARRTTRDRSQAE